MMTFYVCEQHQVAFEAKRQAVGHWNFHHSGGQFPGSDEIARDEVPEGYVLKKQGAVTATKEKEKSEAPAPRRVVPAPVLTGDADATRLGKVLTSIGVPENEVNTIVSGFINIPQFRNDPNALYGWLDTHISDKRLKTYIPLAVQEVFDSGRPAQPFYPSPQQQPPYFYPQQPGYLQQYPPYYPIAQPIAQRPTGDSETLQQVQILNEQVSTLKVSLEEERRNREREKREQEQKEREREVDSRFEKLTEAVSTLKESLASKGEPAGDSKLDTLLSELKEMRAKMEEEKYNLLLKEISVLKQQVANNKPQAIGRTTEDIASELGPIIADKVDKAGERLLDEMGRLREQAIPVAKEQAGKAMPRSIQEIAEVVQLENEIIKRHKEATKEATAEQPQEPPQERVEVPVEPPGEPTPGTSHRMRRMK